MGNINFHHMAYTAAAEAVVIGVTAMIDHQWLIDNAQWVAFGGVVAFPIIAVIGALLKKEPNTDKPSDSTYNQEHSGSGDNNMNF